MKNILKFLLSIVLVFCFINNFADAKITSATYKVLKDKEGVYVIEINSHKTKDMLVPYVAENLETNDSVYRSTNARLCVNAGFFDPKNQKTVSYVVIDEKPVADPKENENLMNNPSLEKYMDKILNRSEFRVFADGKGRIIYDIAPHNDKIPEGYTLKHSIQAGPMLLPDLRLEEEFFVLIRKGKLVSESASALHQYARTAIGIKDNNVYLFIITNEAPMTLKEVAELAHKWGMEKAMAFDGGGSTSFDSPELHIISEKDNQARRLKSFLILQ